MITDAEGFWEANRNLFLKGSRPRSVDMEVAERNTETQAKDSKDNLTERNGSPN